MSDLQSIAPLKILIVEDEPKVAAFIKQGLSVNGFEADIAYDGEIGLAMASGNTYDGLVLDIGIPHHNGFEVCKRIREYDQKMPILILSALGSTNDKLKGFGLGADDYLVKPFEFEELLARLRALIKRSQSSSMGADILRVEDLEMDLLSRRVTRAGKPINLTAKEFTLLELLMRNKGRVLSRVEIAEKIWELNFDSGSNIIDLYIFYLRKKIEKEFDQKLIHTLHGVGYVLRKED